MLFGLAAVALLASCNDKETGPVGNDLAPVITAIYLEDGQSSVPDRLVEFARLGQTIRLEGQNLRGVVKVYINGYDSAFNTTLMSEGSMVVNINTRVPVLDAAPEVKDKVRVVKYNGLETSFDFIIRASAPSITDVSHTLARAGEMITVRGTNLHGATEILFPGDIPSTEFISDDEDGEFCRVLVPAGITTSGSIKITGANGTAVSAPYFNFTQGILHNFDDIMNNSWSSGMDNPIIEADVPPIPADGTGPKSQGRYHTFNSTGAMKAPSEQRYWLNSNNLRVIFGSALSPTTTTELCGIQMDIYVEGTWSSGMIRFTMVDGSGSQSGCMVYRPILVNGARTPDAFVNPGEWFTITLPFGSGADFAGKTLSDVIDAMAKAPYAQSGPWFDNQESDNGYELVEATQKIYFDNIRIVPLEAPVMSDYPDEDEQEPTVE